jgi:hypothetical protein
MDVLKLLWLHKRPGFLRRLVWNARPDHSSPAPASRHEGKALTTRMSSNAMRVTASLFLPLLFLPALAVAGEAECGPAIAAAEQAEELPAGLLAAMGRVESGRRGADGRILSWPWAVNALGRGWLLPDRSAALARVRGLQAQGARLIDVGCMQVNLHHHPAAFASLEEAFDPHSNARYAARFLRRLHAATGDWMQAAARYHSADPVLGAAYRRRVEVALGRSAAMPVPAPAPRPAEQPSPVMVWRPGAAAPWPVPAAGAVLWLRPPRALPRVVQR